MLKGDKTLAYPSRTCAGGMNFRRADITSGVESMVA